MSSSVSAVPETESRRARPGRDLAGSVLGRPTLEASALAQLLRREFIADAIDHAGAIARGVCTENLLVPALLDRLAAPQVTTLRVARVLGLVPTMSQVVPHIDSEWLAARGRREAARVAAAILGMPLRSWSASSRRERAGYLLGVLCRRQTGRAS